MGWLWASPSAKGENTSSSSSQQLPSQQSTPNNSENTTNNDKPTESPSSSSSSSSSSTPYNPYADPELVRFMTQLNTELRSSTSPSTPSSSSPSSSSSWFSSPPDPAPAPLDPLSESLLPRKMSCQQSFDQAFYCNSFGGQWMSVYRTGAARSCSEYWSEFWFCMRARSMRAGEARDNTVRDYYRRRELARYGPGRPSSTDVWEPRTERLAPGEAFSQPYVAPEVDDEEWRRLEIQRRRMVREYLDREAQQEQEEREKKRAARAARIKAKQEAAAAAAAAATAEPK
ncbi:hypothetical protein F5X96DRAFT_296263 [Biscogniauxia mediterranea]|nr:hypothetical protein F5X96DRAFT_296263 [Biscogniauxia mediterranea]